MQPNQYDCGLYLLHFNYLFMKNPDMFMRPTLVSLHDACYHKSWSIALGPSYKTLKKGHASGAEIEWEAGVIPTMHEMLKAELLKLSDEWQQLSGRWVRSIMCRLKVICHRVCRTWPLLFCLADLLTIEFLVLPLIHTFTIPTTCSSCIWADSILKWVAMYQSYGVESNGCTLILCWL